MDTSDDLKMAETERQSILDDELTGLSNELSGYKMNSEMKQAWITEIIPPNSSHSKSTSSQVIVEYMLPNQETFSESFTMPDDRWNEDNEFIQFLDSNGIYSPENLSELLGTKIDIRYDKSRNSWTRKTQLEETSEEENSLFSNFIGEKTHSEIVMLLFRAISASVLFVIASLAVIYMRHIGVIFAAVFIGIIYFVILAPVLNNS